MMSGVLMVRSNHMFVYARRPHAIARWCMLAALAWGQAFSAPTARAADPELGPTASPQQLLADQFVLLARGTLLSRGEPTPAQLTRAGILLEQATALQPRDAEIWRLRLELARRTSDADTEQRSLQEIARIQPEDDVVQYQLIVHRLAPMQTVEQRIAVIERMLTAQGAEQLSPALRSKLATYAAAGAREIGDGTRLAAMLRQATSLDPSNVAAAQMVYDILAQRKRPAQETGSALLRVIEADPMAPMPRRTLADLLVRESAYREAAVQYRTANTLGQAIAEPAAVYPWVLSLGATGRNDDALQIIAQVEQAFSQAAVTQPAATQPANDAAATTPAPATVALPIDLELLRLVLLQSANQPQVLDAALQRVTMDLRPDIDAGHPHAKVSLAWLLVMLDRTGPEAGELIESLNKDASPQGQEVARSPMTQRVRGWLALRAGQLAQARQLLQPLAEGDPFAMLGLALSRTDAAEKEARVQALQQTVRQAPVSLAALLASRALLQGNEQPKATEAGRALSVAMDRWQGWMASPTLRAMSLLALDLRISPLRYGYLEPIEAQIVIRNLTEMPLALDGAGVVPTRAAILLGARSVGQGTGALPPAIVDLSRRIRLDGRATLTVPVRLDRADLGLLLTMRATDPITFTATAILDPVLVNSNTIAPGPRGLASRVPVVERRASPASEANVQTWLAAMNGRDTMERLQALALLTLVVGPLSENAATRPMAERIAAALNPAFSKLDPLHQAWVVRFLPPQGATRELLAPVYDIAIRSKDPLVQLSYLATQITDPASPEIDAALRSGDERVKRYAATLKAQGK